MNSHQPALTPTPAFAINYNALTKPEPFMVNAKAEASRLELIIGPMYSGKSTELIRRVGRYKYRGTSNKILLINHISDKRYSSNDLVSTHCGKSHAALG